MDTMKDRLLSWLPGLLLFTIAMVIGFQTYQDYGIGWDEPRQRELGILAYDYAFVGKTGLLTCMDRYYGTGFEIPLVMIEKYLKLTDSRDIYLMRHLVSHILFLLSALSGYFLVLRLTKDKFLASLAFCMFALSPRIYAHSYFNSKDLVFLSMFLISFNACQYAFQKNKPLLYLLAGLSVGYTTSIRIMGVMLFGLIFLFMILDVLSKFNYVDQKTIRKPLLNLALYLLGFSLCLYIAWPFLWANPVGNLIESYKSMSKYGWDANLLINGNYVKTVELPWTYFPTWFLISNPVLWLIAGVGGLWLIIRDFFRTPARFIVNKPERNYFLYFLCFLAPIFAVIGLNSVIYDDWRHLYFVYPSFVLVGIYFFYKLLTGIPAKFRVIVYAVCTLQVGMVVWFMVQYHPFQQVYFNELVSHSDESLRENYELEYWGCSFKQGLEHLVSVNKTDTIRLTCNYDAPLLNNIMMLPAKDRGRIKVYGIPQMAHSDYFITNFRGHPEDYPSKNIEYSIKVLNSTIMCIYKLDKKTTTQKVR